ncbi:hypothetical protein BRCON_2036 [Candidatus Sumerlaea chitinivorans]|uniref:Uncharacterized protein n=1 Tax=Sumerlaea chitinivorans TaxID=2250252 RepID=A0A2Z4Y8P0_SUMC1|nr:hypothetical protein BRCON_2036 [Candidatus Sumerlaea chitinivorans]
MCQTQPSDSFQLYVNSEGLRRHEMSAAFSRQPCDTAPSANDSPVYAHAMHLRLATRAAEGGAPHLA